MKTFSSFILKEIKHILRDRRTMLILFGMPLVMMLLFGFAISTDVKDVRIAVVTTSSDQLTRHIVERLNASEYFQLTHHVTTDFAAHRYDGSAQIQLILDGADPNMATQQGAYASQIIASEVANAVVKPYVEVVTKLLYNPQMKSAYNFVPGIMGMLLLLICAMMTSVSIVREKERGTMEVLLVSPVRPLMILIAKVIPYFVLSVMILFLILGISNYVLEVPVSGNLLSILCLCLLYIFLALALGLLISVVANTQLEALLISGMLMLLPSMLLSGMIYPIESMPQILQWVSAVIPARWFISAIRKLMIMGVGMNRILPELIILVGMGLLILIVALKKFKQRLE